MLESLLAHIILAETCMITDTEYSEHLHELFLKPTNNDLLLELEWCFQDIGKSAILIWRHYMYENSDDIDYNDFGKILLGKLKEIYLQNIMDINDFGAASYNVWNKLPKEIKYDEPFFTLCHAGDSLCWEEYTDEKHARALFENLFDFYT